ncbi:MAG: hypothetical protein QOJ00_2735, partial [Actinomycetota bacterium]
MTDVFAVPGVDELFDGELADFVARRDALSKQLKKDGDKDAAAAVKVLRKPSTVAWAVNHVARRRRDDIAALLTAGRAVREAQVKAVRGQGDGGLRATTTQWRTQIRALAGEVAKTVGEQYRDDAAATFEAASTDDEVGALLQAGHLMAAASPSGFGLAGMPDPPERPAPPTRALRVVRDEDDVDEGQHEDETDPPVSEVPEVDERALARARERLDEREAALEKATMKLRRAEQRLEQAQQAVDDANEARDAATAARDEAASHLAKATSPD